MNDQDNGAHMPPDENSALAQSAVSAGAQLAAARKALGWSVEDVAAQLNLAPRQVQAIESDNHAALPGLAITRGFIRAYAKLVRIEAAPLLASVRAEVAAPMDAAAPRKVVAAPFSESRLPSMGNRKRHVLPMIAIVGAIAVAAIGYWGMQNQERVTEMLAVPPAPAVVEESVPEVAPPVPADQTAPNAATEAAAVPAAQPPVTEIPPAGTPAPMPEPAATPVQPPEAATSSSAETVRDELRLAAREETWVEIRRASGNGLVLSRLMKVGETETLTVAEPLSVLIGNAGGVSVTLRGTPVPLRGGSGNVTKISVK